MSDEVKLAEVIDDPVLVNDLNAEAWWQSGVMWWGTGGVLWSLGAIAVQVSTHGSSFLSYDVNVMMTAGGALVTAAMVLYRRFWPGLNPLFYSPKETNDV